MLFLTQHENRHDLGSLFARNTDDAWTKIKLWGFDPFFIVTYAATSARLAESWIVAKLNDVQVLRAEPDESGETAEITVHLMSPWWLHRADQWQIYALEKVFEGKNPKVSTALFRYQLSDGRLLERDVGCLEPQYDADVPPYLSST